MSRLFVASTGQNVGKTTTCLGLFSGLHRHLGSLGYLKPVGQEWVEGPDHARVDKDILLFKERFNLTLPLEEMSPVLLPRGFTKSFLDGKIRREDLAKKIEEGLRAIEQKVDFTLIEGTGHMGVGALIELSNAEVAKLLDAPMILIAPGGVGFSFDQIALNKALSDQHGVELKGVILNKVKREKLKMVESYMEKALGRWGIPLLGCIAYDPFLSTPTLADFEKRFSSPLISGRGSRLHHFSKVEMVATSIEVFEKNLSGEQLIITDGAREDIILAALAKYRETDRQMPLALLLTGQAPRPPIMKQIVDADLPCLISPLDSFETMRLIHTHTAKIGARDSKKIEEAIQIVESSLDFDTLLQKLSN